MGVIIRLDFIGIWISRTVVIVVDVVGMGVEWGVSVG